jgi:Leucine-rich repeat (LRR) protein
MRPTSLLICLLAVSAAGASRGDAPYLQYSVNNVVFGWNLADKTISVDEIAPISGPLSAPAEEAGEGESTRIPVSKDGRSYFRVSLPAGQVAPADLSSGLRTDLQARTAGNPAASGPSLSEVMRRPDEPVRPPKPQPGLEARTWRYIRHDVLVDEGPVGEIKGLTGLFLANESPDVADLSPLADLRNLPDGRLWLDLSFNRMTDAGVLASLKSCWWLYLTDDGLTNIAPLAELKELRALHLSLNPVQDLRPLGALPNLSRLYLSQAGVRDLAALVPLKGLKGLDLSGNALADLRPLAGLRGLEWLHAGGNQVADLAPLAALVNLRLLNLGANGVADAGPLAGLTNLVMLHLPANRVADLAPLASLARLTTLNLAQNGITNLAPLAGLTALTALHLNGNRIEDVAPLAGLENLRTLNLAQNGITNLAPLAGLRQLTHVFLFGNKITDLTPLVKNTRGLGKGDSLWLVGNPLSDEARAKQIPALKARGVDVHF